MRNTQTTSDILPAPVATRRRALTITLGVLQILVAFLFAGGGWLKLSGAPEMVDMFATNLFILNADPRMPIGLLLMSALIAWGRWPQTKSLAGLLTR